MEVEPVYGPYQKVTDNPQHRGYPQHRASHCE
jgi:hypothetical protein